MTTFVLPLYSSDATLAVAGGKGVNLSMSSLACCLLLARHGIEPILQLTARDYNRFALQSEALGAAALGIHKLCVSMVRMSIAVPSRM